jgi:hypothetical protein
VAEEIHRRTQIAFWALLIAVVLWVRLAHLNIVWVEEAYGLAAAKEILRGKVLYRDIWFDKPPLYALFYLPVAKFTGPEHNWLLRIWGSAFVLACAVSAWRIGAIVGEARASRYYAAGFTAFFLSFDHAAMTIALAPDVLMVLPHLWTLDAVVRRRFPVAGLCVAMALFVNAKAIFILPAVALFWFFQERRIAADLLQFLLSFVLALVGALGVLATLGVLPQYWQSVWQLGAIYASDTFVAEPWREGLLKTAGWLGFHAALCFGMLPIRQGKWWSWLTVSLVASFSGLRFFPRYYFQPLVPAVAMSSVNPRPWILLLLLIPLVRFGGRTLTLTTDVIADRPHHWNDTQLFYDACQTAQKMDRGSILVWGYRPEVMVCAPQATLATKWIDSQMLTGVFADRHLSSTQISIPDAALRRKTLSQTPPVWIVDGLSPMQPQLTWQNYPELADWLPRYRPVYRTKTTVLYRRTN